MSKARDLADFISTGSILSDGTIESTEISGVTADATEINKLDGLTADTTELNKLDGVTATTTELNKLAGTTATTSDFDKLSNVTASATELNYMTGATSSIQSQLDNISVTSGSLTKTFTNGESATITLAQSITPAPVVSVTKEVAQVGQSSKGAWDVNATASNYDLHNTAYSTTLAKGSVTVTSDVSGSSYDSVTFSVASQQGDPQGCTFGDNGYKLYVAGKAPQAVHQYNLTTAYDLSTASYASKVLSTSANSNNTRTVAFKSDGTVAYVLDGQGGQVLIYNLSTAWDISTAGSPTSFAQSATGRGLAVSPDGTKFYVGLNTDVREYTLSTAWDTSTATLTHTASGITATELAEIALSSDGTRLYILNRNSSHIEDYTLSTAYDLSTVSSQVSTFSTASQDNDEQGIMLNGDDSKIYMIGKTNDLIYQYTNSTTTSDALTLGTGSFASTDVGKRIQGNGGDVILTSTAGAYDTTGGSDFTDTSTIASGSWTMHGLKSAGADDGLTLVNKIELYGDVDTYTYDNVYFDLAGQIAVDPTGMWFKPDGLRVYLLKTNDRIYWYNLSTAWDITTASYGGDTGIPSNGGGTYFGFAFNPDGTKMFGCNFGFDYITEFNLNPAWDVTSLSYQRAIDLTSSTYGSANNPGNMAFNNDGTRVFITSTSNDKVVQLNLSTAYSLSGASLGSTFSTVSQTTSPFGIVFNSDGTKMLISSYSSTNAVFQYSLSTAFDISTATYDSKTFSFASEDTDPYPMFFKNDGSKLYMVGHTSDKIHQYTSGTSTIPTSQYHLAVTKTSGQIDSAFWTDINSMTADQSLGDGEAYYAVSTDDRTTWSVAKGSDGVRPIVRDNAGTWQYNTAAGSTGYSLSNFTYANKSYDASGTHANNVYSLYFKSDGTSIYAMNYNGGTLYQHDLSTAYDISTASYSGNSFSASQFTNSLAATFSSDGTKVYLANADSGNESVYQYNMTTAWDISTASYANKSFDPISQVSNTFGIAINDDGSIFYIADNGTASVYQYTLSTPYDISTASYANKSQAMSAGGNPYDLHFTSDGLLLFITDSGGEYLEKHTLTTAWDLSTASFTERVYTYNASQVNNIGGVTFNPDGTKLYLADGGSGRTIYQYSTEEVAYTTSTTWTDATTNDEFYALQEALGATSVNRMDKTQLDAVADGSHFTLGDTLDLMIALKQDTASASLPTSDGVTINYDAEALNQGAVLGTDYDFDFPANNKVRITSNAAQNLKIRVV